jgi:hypothetical protein
MSLSKSKLLALTVVPVALLSSTAWAEEKTEKGTVTLETIKIKGRPARPNVAIDVARLVPRAPLPELRQPLIQRIGAAVERDPF